MEQFIKHRNIDLRFPPAFCILAVLWLIAMQGFILHFFGQPTISASNKILLWAGNVLSSENSQQLSDWYTFSHIIHGFLFYLLLRYIFPRLTFWQRLVLATGIESAWELIENTPMVIDHYRLQALAQGYSGDSVINSLSDTCAMIIGFMLAWRLPLLAVIALGVFFELWTGFWIHDNLNLNILGFVWRPEFITVWQQSL